MLRKLFKHDFYALSRLLIPTNLAVLVATIFASLGFAYTIRNSFGGATEGVFFDMLQIIVTLLMGLMFVAIFAAYFFIAFVIFHRFYSHFIGNEGYLTFTLPVKTSQLLWSKILSAMLWLIISAVVGIICFFLFILFGTAEIGIINVDVLRVIGEGFAALREIYVGEITVFIILTVIVSVVGSVSGILQIYLSLVMGGVVSQKHKLAAGIGFYFLLNLVVGTITSTLQTFIMVPWMQTDVLDSINYGNNAQEGISAVFGTLVNPILIYSIVVAAVLSVGYYCLTHYLLKNKLNLE